MERRSPHLIEGMLPREGLDLLEKPVQGPGIEILLDFLDFFVEVLL